MELWPKYSLDRGVCESQIHSWKDFDKFIHKILDIPSYVFRGQRKKNWSLEPSLNRKIRGKFDGTSTPESHLSQFKLSIRGRRGRNPTPIFSENDFWAIGQHNGLATPLLDWTESPYVALFFAFSEEKGDETESRLIYALNEERVIKKCSELGREEINKFGLIEFYRPLSDENMRLVNQAGLFTKSPINMNIEEWIKRTFTQEYYNRPLLLKLHIKNRDRINCLKALNLMNINHASLFPDLYGASKYCNLKLEIKNY